MRRADFSRKAPGTLVRSPLGAWAFVPAPLPPEIPATWEMTGALSQADRALSELSGMGRTLPNPHLLIGPFVRREAVLSSRIEGTQSSLSDLVAFEALPGGNVPRADVREVANYVRALEYGMTRLKKLPLSLRLLRELHERLMEGVRGGQSAAGEFRRTQNWIGPAGCRIDDATYVPPPPPEMAAALGAMEKFMHAPSTLPALVRLALLHYQFEAIHPFHDGNGRVGRLLVTLGLCAEGLISQPLLYLSAYFERRRSQYYQLLLGVSQRGDWTAWVRFFLEGVADQAGDALRRAASLLELRETLRRRLPGGRASSSLLRLVDGLFQSPALTAGAVARLLGVSARAAQQNIDKLVRAGILTETTGRPRNRVFAALEIIRAVESPLVH